jgi:hypothetical protein|tara:strand:- start:797 stop:1075 length:279 start_codon:yes stop_codon:yes gene_type:complete
MPEYKGMEDEEMDDEELKEVEEIKTNKKVIKKKEEVQPVQRYAAFNQAQRMGIIDSETNEVIAEGEFAIFQALAKIISEIEEIRNNLGSMIK